MLCLFRACMVNDSVRMTCGFSFWTLTILVYDAHVMIFFYMNKVETLMYELVYECMMKVPLFVNFFLFTNMNDVCMIRYESMHEACPHVFFHFLHCMKLISIDSQFVVIFRFLESFCFDFFLWKVSFGLISLLRNFFLNHCFLNTIWVTYMKLPKILEGIR